MYIYIYIYVHRHASGLEDRNLSKRPIFRSPAQAQVKPPLFVDAFRALEAQGRLSSRELGYQGSKYPDVDMVGPKCHKHIMAVGTYQLCYLGTTRLSYMVQ